MSTKDLDFGNVIKQVYDPASESLNVNIVSGGGGAATEAKQDAQIVILNDIENNTDGLETSLSSVDTKLTTSNTSLDNIEASNTAIENSADAIEASNAAIQTSAASIDTKATAIETNTAATAASVASIDAKTAPLTVLGSFNVDFSSIPDSASAPFEVTAGLASAVRKISFYDTTGATIQVRTGATTGTLLMYSGPGQDNVVDALVATSTRITIRSDATAPTAGSFIITFLG